MKLQMHNSILFQSLYFGTMLCMLVGMLVGTIFDCTSFGTMLCMLVGTIFDTVNKVSTKLLDQ